MLEYELEQQDSLQAQMESFLQHVGSTYFANNLFRVK